MKEFFSLLNFLIVAGICVWFTIGFVKLMNYFSTRQARIMKELDEWIAQQQEKKK